ncbi:E3 ubiquitin-protein ligase [Entamoeba marina]
MEKEYQQLVDDILGVAYDTAVEQCKDIVHTKVCRVNSFQNGKSLVYKCRTCSRQNNSCICPACFHSGDHTGHDYIVEESDGFTCDCGSEENWDPKGYCSRHGKSVEGDALQMIPVEYEGIIERLENLVKRYIDAFHDKNEHDIEMISLCFIDLTQINLFFLVLARILSRPLHDTSYSILVQKLHYPTISYFEHLYEILFLENQYNLLSIILTSYNTDMSLVTFPHSTIMDLSILGLSLKTSNVIPLDSTFTFRSNKTYNVENFFFNDRLINFFEVATLAISDYAKNPKPGVSDIANIVDFIYAYYAYSPKKSQNKQFSVECLDLFLKLLDVSSNIDPVLIKTGDHVEDTTSSLHLKLHALNSINFLSKRTLQMLDVNQLKDSFPVIQKSYVPQAKLNGHTVDLRIAGVNQPVSPFSVILPFYTTLLVKFQKANIQIDIDGDDAFLILQLVFLSLRFKQQICDGRYKRNDDSPAYFYLSYVSIFTYSYLLNDLSLPRLLSKYLDNEKILAQWAVMFEVFNVGFTELNPTEPPIQELTTQNLNLDNLQNINSFLRSIAEVERRFEITESVQDEKLLEEVIIHLVASGVSSPSEIAQNTSLRYLPLEDIYDLVCERRGILKPESQQRVDPFFPLLSHHREVLLNNVLLSPTTTSPNRFSFYNVDPFSKFRSISFIYDIVQNVLNIPDADFSVLPYFIIFLSDGRNSVSGDYDTLKDIGTIIGKHRSDVVGCSNIIIEIGGALAEGFEESKPSKNLASTGSRKEAMMLKFQKMQQHYAQLQGIDEGDEEIVGDVEDGCIVCQMKTSSVLGRMVAIVTNISLKNLAPMTVTGCMHRIHKDCCDKLENKTCPLCNAVFTHFLPLKSEIMTLDYETIYELYLTFFDSYENLILAFCNCIDSTIHSITAANAFGYSLTTSDIDIVDTIYQLIRHLVSDVPQYAASLNITEVFPEIAIIILRASGLPVADILSIISENLAYSIEEERKLPEQQYTLEQLIELYHIEHIKPFNVFLEYFTRCITPRDSFIPFISLDAVKTHIKFKDYKQHGKYLPCFIPPLSLVRPPDTIQTLMDSISLNTCAVCRNKPVSYKECSVCLVCGKFVCDNRNCFIKHCDECSPDTSVYFYLMNGRICISRNGVSVSEIIYFNKYGDQYFFDILRKSEYFLDQDRLHKMNTIIPLGTSAGEPTMLKNTTSNLIELNDGNYIVIDCGSGIYTTILRMGIDISKIIALFVTHLHVDHVGDIVSFAGNFRLPKTFKIYGPQGIKEIIGVFEKYNGTKFVGFETIELSSGDQQLQDLTNGTHVTAIEIPHAVKCYGYLFDNPNGLRVCYLGDTSGVNLSYLGKIHVLIHEATYGALPNVKYHHSNTKIAAECANGVEADYLLLNHFSVRFQSQRDFINICKDAQRYTRANVWTLYEGQPFSLCRINF